MGTHIWVTLLSTLLVYSIHLSKYLSTYCWSLSKDPHSQRPQTPPSLQTIRDFLLFQHVVDPLLSMQARGETQNKQRTHFLYLVRGRFRQQGSWLILIGVASNLFRHWLICIVTTFGLVTHFVWWVIMVWSTKK